jgi:ABC-type dipeptide/oligopeptide/nickel transport system permease component
VLRASAGSLLGLLSTALPMLLVAAAVFERAFALRGLGEYTVEAVRQGNVAWLMAMALFGTVFAALLQLLSDELATALGYQRLRHARTDAIVRIR